MEKNRLPKSVYEQLASFRYRIRKFIRFSEEAARQKGLTPQYHQLMLAIMGFPERDYATPKELAERLQITPHACLELIQRCEELELVKRSPNEKDRRSIFIHLTEQGMALLEELSEIHRDELKRAGLLDIVQSEQFAEFGTNGHERN
ncbi:DNA-binding MarR family transcriptional regulator [Paenibacillus phyllosphaerae]|uniref:DNA-binding MarR family transcriptional regulator n=1 Tax=Paenibacillus phyllosphaerae TaxID=274593 RepID=A0A7W5B2U8_9BACL|nr:MarR family transcriptional regulator [Paenibacillus phyllosphaerae]MBB3112876.1 DNA-binding MarR family transcriptional regulator [Paenibacillus phyllosphaerae]